MESKNRDPLHLCSSIVLASGPIPSTTLLQLQTMSFYNQFLQEKTARYIHATQPSVKTQNCWFKVRPRMACIYCIWKWELMHYACHFYMNFTNSATWQAYSAFTAHNKRLIEHSTVRAILMCHIKSQHKDAATDPTQTCFFQILLSLLSRFKRLPTILSFKDCLTYTSTLSKTPTSPFLVLGGRDL